MKAEKGNKVKVDYVGSLTENGTVFDTSIETKAKEFGIYNEKRTYQPLDVELGAGQVIPGFENALVGMEVNETKKIDIPTNEAYGERKDDLVAAVPKAQFEQNEIDPQVGMMLQTQMGVATIVKVEEENVLIDHNHMLAGKDLTFELTLVEIVS